MAGNYFDPGGSNRPPSYANRVKKSLRNHKKLDRNVLEIIMEKKNKEFLYLNGDEVAQVCEIVGVRVGSDTQGYQAQYSVKGITLSVWVNPNVSLEKYVTRESKEFNSDLIITAVRPAVRREVTVLVTGLHFNTPDDLVSDYIECFGAKVVRSETTYGVHREGPWKGK